ncbi:carbohydrate ABC transporter permease [Rhizobium leguminosarum]|uniref:carbohydrate ABC transporter permease n=1 Tax=Rhizobium leguminosarum TaxID=384 RepID=UPI0017DC1752|nr:sugar ABC transporter permease [Rhizobium leguminosarum]MBB4504752.1 multiple sugar transport system permease protein [Rhizobium leguminosarum]
MTERAPYAGRASVRQWWTNGNALPYLLLLPSVVVIGVVILIPFFEALQYSFTNSSLLEAGTFVGFDNYTKLLSSKDFWNAFRFSVIFALANVVGCYILGLGLALLMNMEMPFRGFFRVALLLPWIIPSVVSIVSWRWMVADHNAVFNQIIQLFGGRPIFFLSNNDWAQFTVVLIKIWRSFPFMMLSLLAALQGIDRSLYEAAALDGATKWKAFWHVTLPQIRDVSIVLCLLMTIWSVNDFDTPFLLTQGGPANSTENFVLLAYKYTFARNDLGTGAAISFVTLIILMVFIVIMLRRQREA